MNTGVSSKRSPFLFFALVYAISIPFWVLNTIFPIKLPVDNLPVTDIAATFTPMVAASILMYREEGFEGVKNLLKRAFDCKRITKKVWYISIIFLTPFIFVLTYMINASRGATCPDCLETTTSDTAPLYCVLFCRCR
ncbi:MAG: hypothetical protein WA127_07805 [Methanothrix sp.]|jgi:hypothetical protein